MAVSKQDKQREPSIDSVVVSSSATGQLVGEGTPKRLFIGVIILICLLLVAAGVAWRMSQGNDEAQVTLKEGPAISGQVDNLDSQQVDALASAKTDAEKNVNEAYAKALALSRQNKNQESVQEFKDVIAAGDGHYYVYVDYALVQGRSGNLDEGIKTMQLAIEKLKNDATVSNEVKSAELKYLNNVLVGMQDEAANS